MNSADQFKIGDVVKGRVTERRTFGVFVQITEIDFGLIKTVNLAEEFDSAEQLPDIGTVLRAIVIEADHTEVGSKLNLSQRQADFLKFGSRE